MAVTFPSSTSPATDAFVAYHPGYAWSYLAPFHNHLQLQNYAVSEVSKDYRKLVHEFTKLGLFDKKGHNVICLSTIAMLGVFFCDGTFLDALCGGEWCAASGFCALVLTGSKGDGLLSLEDFVTVVKGVGEEEKKSDLKAAFELYAPEGSAYLTPVAMESQELGEIGEPTVATCDSSRSLKEKASRHGDELIWR
ncbi:hypothetical protein SASPL_105344 [Salvia splendens]|uniref:EF-hand domain-containing protein n=1 Tax=Salvia splendens TaxID=180675 RepID=A0A8X8YKW1_SALSN|nr:hypothetical protein SASPL_105344 [Salvia splendens]